MKTMPPSYLKPHEAVPAICNTAEFIHAPGNEVLVGASAPVERLRRQIHQYAPSRYPVLIVGESGSGKEIVASMLHQHSNRNNHRYFAVNCAAIAPNLVEAALFGFAKGAFTGASNATAGYFGDVEDGTLFLDEIGELPMEVQAKLLRVLENGTYQRVGETMTRVSHARIIAATNRDLKSETRDGRYRVDLYHRLSVFTLSVPPLRELGDDRRLLLHHFLTRQQAQTGLPPFELTEDASEVWMHYDFPGNVRELRNIVIRLMAKYAGHPVDRGMLLAELDNVTDEPPEQDPTSSIDAARRRLLHTRQFDLDRLLAACERCHVQAALAITGGNLSRAARMLGIRRTTLYSRILNYPIKLREPKQ